MVVYSSRFDKLRAVAKTLQVGGVQKKNKTKHHSMFSLNASFQGIRFVVRLDLFRPDSEGVEMVASSLLRMDEHA